MTSWAYLIEFGLKLIFHWEAQLYIISKSLWISFVELWLSWTTENKDVLSGNNLLALVESPSERSFIHIQNNNDPRMKPWVIPAVTFFHVEIDLWKLHFVFSRLKGRVKCWINSLIFRFELIWKLYHCATLC